MELVMTRVQQFLQELEKRRTPIIGPEILEYVKQIAKDKKKGDRIPARRRLPGQRRQACGEIPLS